MENCESLFSFELVVKSVSNLLVECTAPAVGFRLLDYPTVMIYHTDIETVENLRLIASDQPYKQNSAYSVAGKDGLRPNLREGDGTFSFQKGKSTLFSMKQQKLFTLLSSVPLYIVLVDVYGENSTRIIGSCTVPLQSIVDELKEEGCHGSHVAAFSKRAINLSLFNLMGARIGQLKGNITLYCYGNALNKHFQTSSSIKEKSVDVFLEKHDSKLDTINSDAKLSRFHYRKSLNSLKKIKKLNKSTETDQILHFDTHLRNDNAYTEDLTADKGETGESKSNIDNHQHKIISNVNDYDVYMGTFCPPPLFYCSENIDPLPIRRGSKQSMHNYQGSGDQDHRMKVDSSSARNIDCDMNHDRLGPEVTSCKKTQGPFRVQPETRAKIIERRDSREAESNKGLLPQTVNTESTVDLGAVLGSLDDMPLLQGLFKEIVEFTKREYALKSKVAKGSENIAKGSEKGAKSFEPMPDHSKNKEDNGKVPADDEGGSLEYNRKALVEKRNFRNDRATRKLKFKATKSHKLRCALNAAKKRGNGDYKATTEIADREEELDYHASKLEIKEVNPLRQEQSEGVNMITKHLPGISDNTGPRGVTDIYSNFTDQASMKSRSPVSIEIYMPSATGSKSSSESPIGHNNGNDASLSDDSVDHSNNPLSKPLGKKWSGLDDLSNVRNSTDFASHGNEKTGYKGSYSPNFAKEEHSTSSYSPKRAPSSKYSDHFHSMSDSASQSDEAQLASRAVKPLHRRKSPTHGSASDRSRTSGISSRSKYEQKSQGQGLVLSQNSSRRPSSHSLQSPHSSLQSQSIRTTPRKNSSDASKPVISAHSPTTSRSLRTKPRNTYVSNDEITRSIDISSSGSQRTDSSGEEGSLPRDGGRDGVRAGGSGQFNEEESKQYNDYSDDFVTTNSINSRLSSALDEHRSPTPRHIILSQAKLGYTM